MSLTFIVEQQSQSLHRAARNGTFVLPAAICEISGDLMITDVMPPITHPMLVCYLCFPGFFTCGSRAAFQKQAWPEVEWE